MGLKEKTENNTAFLLVKHHSLILESKEPKEGYDPIEVTNPRTNEQVIKYIKRYAAVDGMVRKIEWYDTEQKFETRYMGIKIHIRDNGDYFQLELPFNSRSFDSFVKLAENIDFTKPVEFSVWHDRKQDSTAFAVKQDGIPVKWKYTKDNMGECPPAVQNKLGKWNFDDQKIWLVDNLTNVVIPHVDALNAFDEPQPEYAGEDADAIAERAALMEPPDDEIGTVPYERS